MHKPMSALPLKADMTATNSRAAYPLPQHMIKMLTVGAFGNDMAADRPLSGWQQSLAPHRICHTREWFRRFRHKSCPWIAEAPNCHRVLSGSASFDFLSAAARCAHTDNLSGWQ